MAFVSFRFCKRSRRGAFSGTPDELERKCVCVCLKYTTNIEIVTNHQLFVYIVRVGYRWLFTTQFNWILKGYFWIEWFKVIITVTKILWRYLADVHKCVSVTVCVQPLFTCERKNFTALNKWLESFIEFWMTYWGLKYWKFIQKRET